MPKFFIVVTGTVGSGLGKGAVMAALGVCLQGLGLDVTTIKIDPYLNMSAGLLSPKEHGEVYVLQDGSEVDLDFGTYERALGVVLTGSNSITGGKAFTRLLKRQEAKDYMGKTVQMTHLAGVVLDMIYEAADLPVTKDGKAPDVCLVEVGGTVGDDESPEFLEAIRQLRQDRPAGTVLHVNLTALVEIFGELKTTPAQQSAKFMKAAGLCPNVVICRPPYPCLQEHLEKVHRAYSKCGKDLMGVLSLPKLPHSSEVPSFLSKHPVIRELLAPMGVVPALLSPPVVYDSKVRVGVVGKYAENHDAYHSVGKVLHSVGAAQKTSVEVVWVPVEAFDTATAPEFDAVVVPGGFGERGVEETIEITSYLGRHSVPVLAICMGLQCAFVGAMRALIPGANSEEYLDEKKADKGEAVVTRVTPDLAMNLGAHEVTSKGTAYRGRHLERFRNRYGVEVGTFPTEEDFPFRVTGVYGGHLVASMVHKTHPYFVGTQYHPEFHGEALSGDFFGLLQAALKARQAT